MRIERLVGLYVSDEILYSQYREQILPLLKQYRGGFSYDFEISKVLKSETKEKINRLFIIYFPSEESMNLFFSNKEYLDIKEKYFSSSVSEVTEISKLLII